MTAYALISGVVFRAPVQKTSRAGKPFTTCTIKSGSDDGAGDFWSVLCFSESAQLEMLRLEAGDAVSVRGKLKLELYAASDGTTKISRSIFADAAIGLRPAPRTPRAKAAKPAPTSQETTTTTSTATDPGLDDSIPF